MLSWSIGVFDFWWSIRKKNKWLSHMLRGIQSCQVRYRNQITELPRCTNLSVVKNGFIWIFNIHIIQGCVTGAVAIVWFVWWHWIATKAMCNTRGYQTKTSGSGLYNNNDVLLVQLLVSHPLRRTVHPTTACPWWVNQASLSKSPRDGDLLGSDWMG